MNEQIHDVGNQEISIDEPLQQMVIASAGQRLGNMLLDLIFYLIFFPFVFAFITIPKNWTGQ